MKPGARGEAGFTLVELLIVVVIEAIIMGGLGSAFVLLLNNSTTVKESLARTSDARYAASYIVSDAANSSGPETSLSDTTSCPDPSPPVTGTASAVVRFDWNATTSTGTTVADIVNYVLVANTLLRRDCENGTLQSDDPLATNISTASVACSPTANCTGTPTNITATITETQGSSTASPYQYSLTGAFRKALAVGAPLPSAPSNPYALLTLGSGTNCATGGTGLSMTASSNMRVYGAAYINSVNAACKAMSLTSNATYQAGSTNILTGGTCAATTGSTCPTVTSYSPALTDPYASVTAPSTTGQPAQSGCSSGHASPGVYASTLTITAACQLASGVYILQNGLSVSGTSAALTTASGGALIYVTGGSITTATSGAITVSPETTGTYAGIAIWQAAANTHMVSFTSGGNLAISGAVYAPAAEVSITSSNANPTFTAIVSQTVFMTSSATVTIGTPSSTPLGIAAVSAPTTWTVNQPYPLTALTGTGGDGNYIWSASGLPTGISLSTDGLASGTPTATGTSTVTLTLNDQLGDDPYTVQVPFTINAAPTISTSSPLASGEKTVSYSATVAGSGGTTAYSWSATGLPAGLTINSGSGVISGTPTGSGTSSASVTLTDAAGATATKSLSITISAGPAISTVALANGGSTAGKLEKGDTITITYSAQMKVSSFCSTWSGDTTNQSLNSNNDVTVTVTNGTSGANDSLTVTSATCTFHFGTLNLGTTGEVSSTATFSGTGSNKSSIAWTASSHTLVITLGTLTGTCNTVGATAPIYSASSSQTDSAGVAVSNSPFTLASAIQF